MSDDKRLCKWCRYCKETHRWNHTKCKGNECDCNCKNNKDFMPYNDRHSYSYVEINHV